MWLRGLAYASLGFGVGWVFAINLDFLLSGRLGIRTGDLLVALPFATIALGLAVRLKKLESPEELNRPLTIFGLSSSEQRAVN